MNIQSNLTFQARIKIQDVAKLSKEYAEASTLAPLATSGAGSSVAGMGTTVASGMVGSGSKVLGTAFSANASGLDSFGIVPAVIDAVTPYATPQTIASANNHPSTIGSMFSTIGNYFQRICKVTLNNKNVKDPS